MVLKRTEVRSVHDGLHCDLCGSSVPAIRCEKCSNQVFCLSCDDMYHRHPKRRTHVRKAVDVPESSVPKVPPKQEERSRLPIPPPRKKKSQKSQQSSPLFGRKSQNPPLPKKQFSFFNKVGSLSRMMTGRPLPPVPVDEPPERPPKSQDNSSPPFRKLSSSCSSYSNVSDNEGPNSIEQGFANFIRDRQSPAYANEPMSQTPERGPKDWEDLNQNRRDSAESWTQRDANKSFSPNQSAYPSSLNKSDTDSGIQMGFQGFPTLSKRGMYTNPFLDGASGMSANRMAGMNTSSVTDLPNRSMGMQMPQAQSLHGLNYIHPMQIPPGSNPYMDPYLPYHAAMPPPPWMYKGYYPPPPDGYQQYSHDMMKRTPSNSSINYACSESGYRLGSYTSMGHLHNPMAMGPFPQYQQPMPQPGCPPSPTQSTRSSRLHRNNSLSGETPFTRTGRRNTAHGYLPGRRPLIDNTSSEEDYFSAGASEEEDMRSTRSGRAEVRAGKQWQCEHCTYINPPNTKICAVCCKTTGQGKSSGERRRKRRDGGVKSPSSGDSIPSSSHQGRPGSRQEGESTVDGTAEVIDKSLAKEIESVMAINTSNKSATPKSESYSSVEILDGTREEQAMNNATTNQEKINSAGENGSVTSTKAEEPQRKAQVMSTGTSPPPQTISTQTQLSDDSAMEEYPSAPMYRTSSRTSLSGAEREFLPNVHRTSSNHGNSNNDQWPLQSNNSAYLRSSRNSLYGGGQSRDQSPARNYRGDSDFGSSYYRSKQYPYETPSRADYYLNLEELIERRRQETMRSQGFELVRLLREAEQNDFTADDVQVAMNHCGKQNPVHWLRDNWKNMVDTVVTLVTNYGRDKQENDIGLISQAEAKDALRLQKGNIWAAVTECVETRQRKFNELQIRGSFSREDINCALTAKEGNVDAAFLELSKQISKPFHLQVWGPPVGVENESGPEQISSKTNQSIFSGLSNATSIFEKLNPDSRRNQNVTTATSVTPPFPVSAQMTVDPKNSVWVQSQSGGTVTTNNENFNPVFGNQKPLETAVRVSRTGSFSGGSVRETTLPTTKTTVNSNTDNQPEDLYVSVQWAAGKKPSPIVSRKEAAPEKVNLDAIYTSLEELTSNNNNAVWSQKMPPKFPVNLAELSDSSYTSIDFARGKETIIPESKPPDNNNSFINVDIKNSNAVVEPPKSDVKPSTTNAGSESKIYASKGVIESAVGIAKNDTGSNLKLLIPEPEVNQVDKSSSINNIRESPVQNNEIIQIDNAKHSVYTTLEEMKSAEKGNVQAANEDAINAAAESILATAQILQSSSPDSTVPSLGPSTTIVRIASPVPAEVEEPVAKSPPAPVAPASPPVVTPPPPPQRTEASKRLSEFEQRVRKFLAEGKISKYSEAEIVVKLIDLEFNETDAITAAKECSTIDMAISFLQQECELCASKFSMGNMISMLNCIHRCCRNCAKKYFTVQIRDRNIIEAICPFCDQPDLTNEEIAQEYFNNLDIMLKNLVEPETHELFQKKLIDRTLMRDPNFHWCSQCSSGFIAPPYAQRIDCPDCKAVMCAKCRKPWEAQHEGISCEKFSEWKEENDPEFQAKGLEKHLEENGIDCPSCRFRYSLAKGGCMHFRCLQCKYDFCSGCGQPFKMGSKCTFSSMCTRLGLHSHHPRNCLFYLRDKDPTDLQKLLQQNGIEFNTDPPPLSAAAQATNKYNWKCQVMEQKEVPGVGFKDDICGHMVFEGYAGLCKLHYIEYLGGLIKKHKIDPLPIFTEDDLELCIRRWDIRLPPRNYKLRRSVYRQDLIQIIQEKIPLEEIMKR